MAVVNDYYGYYQTWSQLSADLSGSYSSFANTHTTVRKQGAVVPGQLHTVQLAGARSGITRTGIVYLPPQYDEPRFAHARFPVVELLHGSPGKPLDWVVHLRLAQIMDKLLAEHLIGPMIVVMPASNARQHFEECVDAPGALDDTYISRDVPADIRARYRASTTSAEWGVAGYSSGGYCAANLSLRHPGAYGAAGIMDGYFRPGDGEAAAALHGDATAEAANDPLLDASRLTRNAHPLPAFWVAAGTGNAADLHAARAFVRALHGVEQVTLYDEPGAGHNFYAWEPAVPRLLAWMWSQLAPPSLRVQFPLAGPVRHAVFAAPGAGRGTYPAGARPDARRNARHKKRRV
jgi:enterochelin esterase-like enzyme